MNQKKREWGREREKGQRKEEGRKEGTQWERKYWVGQKVPSGFSVDSYELFGQPSVYTKINPELRGTGQVSNEQNR